ncbi:prohead protease/major capsid protein fusion protein [Cloacibacillus evryensis]|uniref:Mu-like prophage major head subunit gpT family protein n=1 Tax=Cloacibacillus evryensis TaxID=508460 RepID=A0AAW5K690_9BACT|nr:prohead protease/major capsid protein fusion protein [Cloacibacillus evryensis]EHL68453.1 HK97 family phage prohead protease [Synergistes sp. 3_1_syn1]MCQ4814238.1 Mu-like prophage major head subunit gpT family protein [Cloacibacillus evryensis]
MKTKTSKPAGTREQYFSPSQGHYRDLRLTAAPEESTRSVELSFSSAVGVRRYDWWGGEWYQEILDHSSAAVDLSRLSEIGVGLYNHDMDRVIGRVDDVRLDGAAKKCSCRLTFDDDEDSDSVFRKVQSGSLRGVSVGYRVYQWEEVRSGKTSEDGIEGPAMIARKWEPYEISIVSCPADPTVGVGRNIEERDDVEVSMFRESVMECVRDFGAKRLTETEFDGRLRTLLEGVDHDEQEEAKRYIADIRAAVAREEARAVPPSGGNNSSEEDRARAAEISAICARYGLSQDETAKYIKDGTPVGEVCRAIINAGAKQNPGVVLGTSVSVERDERDKFRAAARDGLRMRLGVKSDKFAPGAEEFRSIRLLNLAKECIERNGEAVGYRDDEMEIAKRAFSTSDFPAIMTDLANVTLLAAYEEAPTTWRQWCSIGSASDFKEIHKVRFGEMPMLEPLLESGEYKMANLVETKDSFSIGTFGKKFALTRQSIINDALGAFTRIPQLFGSAASRTINSTVYKTLISNPTIAEDKKAIFSAEHGNLAETASALGIASLSDARVAMRRQKGLRKDKDAINLNITPQYLIIPPELETLARQILYSDTDISGTNPAVINPMKNAFTPIVEAELEPWAWYLVASPSMIDTVEVAFLNGQQSPVIEQQPGWNIDGMEYKVRIDFGVWLYEYRGMYKNAGAAPSAGV